MNRRNTRLVGGVTAATMALLQGGSAINAAPHEPDGCYPIAGPEIVYVNETPATKTMRELGQRVLQELNTACAAPVSDSIMKVENLPGEVTLQLLRDGGTISETNDSEPLPAQRDISVTVLRNTDGSLNPHGITEYSLGIRPADTRHEQPSYTMEASRDLGQSACDWSVTIEKAAGASGYLGNGHTQGSMTPEDAASIAAFNGHILNGALR